MRLFTCNDPLKISELLQRDRANSPNVDSVVAAILGDVKIRGNDAVLEYTAQFDGVTLPMLEVSTEERQAALSGCNPDFLTILHEAKGNIERYHEKQKRTGFLMTEPERPGVVLGQRITPLDRVGVYVPGGTAAYPSTVLMDIIPAKIAGVKEIVMVSPPGRDGNIPVDILAAAELSGVDRVFKIGGAQAVAALAYGTQSVPRVDKIVGPGNLYVATAKRMVYGLVDIDMIAGPSEILIIADESANPRHVAIDLLSQAEHDRLAAAFLITTDSDFAQAVLAAIGEFLPELPRREIAENAIGQNSAIIVTDTLAIAAEISNQIAPEHLELCIQEPFALLPLIRHAGSIFLGHYAPEALGDYFAGPNHTLPTSGTARFSSGLSVDDFLKKSSIIYYEKDAFRSVAGKIATFAHREGLDAHARSVTERMIE